mmetsp:Transcript_68178/g.160474  ORF Transcript_68178/g.160474 Transcript_68178/m.160474 type:complete len:230 (+) Transcript_68178:3-692(+)
MTMVPERVIFFDGTATLVSRNTFLDVEVEEHGACNQHRSRSTPASIRFDVSGCDDKPVSRSISNATASTECGDSGTWFLRDLHRQTSLDSSVDLDSTPSPCSEAVSSSFEQVCEDWASVHTVMIKNIPCRCSSADVLQAVESLGFAGAYDFFYLPMNRRHKQGLGYAFINFIDKGTAAAFKTAIEGYRFPGRRSPKQVQVAIAQLQGLEEAKEYFSCTRVVHTRFRPML